MDTWRTWDLVLPTLERAHDVLAPTLPGHASGPPLPSAVSGATFVDAVERAMDEAGGHCPQLDVPLETAQLILGFTVG